MRAVQVVQFGPLEDPGTVQVREVSVPEIKPDQVLIEVHYAACNGIDFKMAKGACAWVQCNPAARVVCAHDRAPFPLHFSSAVWCAFKMLCPS